MVFYFRSQLVCVSSFSFVYNLLHLLALGPQLNCLTTIANSF